MRRADGVSRAPLVSHTGTGAAGPAFRVRNCDLEELPWLKAPANRGRIQSSSFFLLPPLIGVGVLGYLYYRQQQEVVKIDVPGFEGSITKDDGVDIDVGKDK